MLVGRDEERGRLRQVLEDAQAGRSGTLVLRGAAGAGKTALLDDLGAKAAAGGACVLRAVGMEGEAHLAYATLGDLLAGVLHLRPTLPGTQARALGAALALEDGDAAPFAVASGLLGLLAAAAEVQPVLLLVDDLQWVDEASRSALLFAARRLDREGVAIVLGAREDEGLDLDALPFPALAVGGLAPAAGLALLEGQGLDPAVAARLAQLTGGSPLALLEVPPLLTPEQRRGEQPLDDPLPLGRDLERAFRRRLERLDAAARGVLLVAACTEDARTDLVLAAAAGLGLGRDALHAAEVAGLVALEGRRIVFRHPLQRAATLQAAAAPERRAAHRALAQVLPAAAPERAWQLAAAAEGPDAEAAAALAAAAEGARSRGAFADAARTFARAADLEPAEDPRARLLLHASAAAFAAARMAEAAGHAHRGARLAHDHLLGADLRAAAARAELRAGVGTGPRETLVREAERVLDVDPVRSATWLLESAVYDMASGRMRRMITGARRAGETAAAVAPPLAFLAALLVGEAQLALGLSEEGDAAIEAALPVLRDFEPATGPPEIVAMAAHSSLWVERFDRAEVVFDRLVGALRQAAVANQLPYPLAARSHLGLRLGRWPAALADAGEAVALAQDTGQELLLAHALGALAEVEAVLGTDDRAREHAERCVALAQAQGAYATALYGHMALGLLALGRGRPEEAIVHGLAAERADARTENDEPGIARYAPDLVEALWRAGRAAEAAGRLDRLERQAERPGHTWTRAVVCRLRGLMAPDEDVDRWFQEALELHARTPQPFETARTTLLYGERLRRARRRADAREPLRRAHGIFDRLGAPAWSERAAAELRATGGLTALPGGAVPAGASPATSTLTAQELQIALHAARGMTNREVGAALFLAPKTVEHHLSRTFRKLGIRGRVELPGALAQTG